MEIRKATLDDMDGVMECLLFAGADNNSNDLDSSCLTSGQQRNDLCSLLSNKHNVLFLVAATTRDKNDDGSVMTTEILGFLVMKKRQQLQYNQPGQQQEQHTICQHLSLLFVHPGAQKQGIGRSLWTHSVSGCDAPSTKSITSDGDSGCDDRPPVAAAAAVTTFTVNSSKIAIPFYSKLGFEITGPVFVKRNRILTPMALHATSSSL